MKMTEYDLIIEPGRVDRQYWSDLWRFRELFYFLAWRDILVRYKQTVVGVAWGILKPLFTMFAFVLVFQKFAKLDSGNIPYPILILIALLPWQFFSSSISEASNSLISNSNLISKVYFPRMIVPVSSIIVCIVDLLFAAGMLVLLMLYYRFLPGFRFLFFPFFFLVAFSLSVGLGLFLSAVNVKFRDFRFVIPFMLQFGLYISPVGFSSDIVPEKWRLYYSLNPMVGIIDGFRWCLIDNDKNLYLPSVVISVVVSIITLVVGIKYFRATEKKFSDII